MTRNTLNSKFRHTLANRNSYKQPAETQAENMEFAVACAKPNFSGSYLEYSLSV